MHRSTRYQIHRSMPERGPVPAGPAREGSSNEHDAGVPAITGVWHTILTVTDLPRAKWFWTEVMGLELKVDAEAMFFGVHRD